MNACAACREQIDLRMDGMLDAALQSKLADHLSQCAACRRYDAAQQALSGNLAALSRVADALAVQQPRKSRVIPNWMHVGRVAAALVFAVLCTWSFVRRPSIYPDVDPRPIPRVSRPPVQLAVSVEPVDNERRIAIPIETDNPRVHMVWLYDSDSPAGDPAPASAPSS